MEDYHLEKEFWSSIIGKTDLIFHHLPNWAIFLIEAVQNPKHNHHAPIMLKQVNRHQSKLC